ncbi:MAG TPA: sensor histidine kinase, partial [Ktedonobacterales bacterium]
MRTAHTAHSDRQAEGISPYLLWLIWIPWLGFLATPVGAILALPPSPQRVIDLGSIAFFIGLYLWITWHEAWRLTRETPMRDVPMWQEWGPIALMLLLSVTMTLIEGGAALGSLIYVSAALCGRLTGWRAVAAVVGLPLLGVLLSVVTHTPLSESGQIFFIVPAVGAFVYYFGRAVRTNQELRRARQEIARLAVSEERLRFARDLHDLLGHTLSLITLKSELARRLVAVAPEQAAVEIGDIETAARQALIEVREAVSGYRQPTLQSELSGARELLAAAGIAFTQRGVAPPLAPGAEAALSWAVREGVTNVIRHSQARSCVITLSQQDGRVTVDVRDDGRASAVGSGGPAAPQHDSAPGDNSPVIATRGAGLAGLRERVAALGGACEAGAAEGGGWRLAVSLPISATLGVDAAAEPGARLPVSADAPTGGSAEQAGPAERAVKRMT